MNDSIDKKLLNYFNGQSTADEEVEILKWLKLDKRNEDYFFRFKENLDPQKMEHPLLESSYAELRSKLLVNQQFSLKSSGRLHRIQLPLSRIAAMLLIAIMTGFTVAYLIIDRKFQKSEVVWFESRVPRGEKSQLNLPDGTKIWMNSESYVSYPSNFMEGNREVKLKGEAYFEVAKVPHSSFTVATNDYAIRVLGTKFNVMAYKDFNRTETSLIEGEIEIQKGEQIVRVEPGETFTYADNKFSIRKTNTRLTASWKDDTFDFDQIDFKELIARLERWYDVDIDIKDPELNGIIYSGVFKNEETIWQVLNAFQLTLPISFTRVDFRKFVIETKK